MAEFGQRDAPERVEGRLDDHWSARLGEPDMTRNEDGTTTITPAIADQAQLHGVLAGLRDIGAVIAVLRTTDPAAPTCRPTTPPGDSWSASELHAIRRAPSKTAPERGGGDIETAACACSVLRCVQDGRERARTAIDAAFEAHARAPA